MKIKTLQIWGVALLTAVALTACNKEPKQIVLEGKTMGTTYHIKYLKDDKINKTSEQMQAEIDQFLKQVNDQMSTYQKDSELSLFNQSSSNQPFAMSNEVCTVVNEAIRLNKITEGALDVTVGPIVNLWGFGPEKRPERKPTEQQIEERRQWVGLDKLTVAMRPNCQLSKSIPELYLDLSSIAKGYGVDLVASTLEKNGVTNYMVEIGGEIKAKGRNGEGKKWQIAIEKPTQDGSRAIDNIIGLDNLAMATSGDYRIYFEENGQRFSHEIDPKTGQPIQHNLASITVVTQNTMTADGLSTGFFVLGAEKALEIAEREKIAIYLIIKNEKGFDVKISSEFKKLLEQEK